MFAGAVDAGPGCAVAGCAWSGVGAGADICTVAGCDVGCESAGCCATALSETSKVAETIQFKVRITLISMFFKNQFLQYANWKTTCTTAVESTG